MKSRRFVDTVRVTVKAGDGGNGCVSFRRERAVPRGGPDGGNGGKGGDVILAADPDLDSLEHLFFAPLQRAEAGTPGRGKQCTGAGGADLRVAVPCGTVVLERESGECLADLVQPGQELLVAAGGRGGFGNLHYLSNENRAPREHTPGGEGDERVLELTLKIVADVGLVGFPNAGKSSLLCAISHAHPKVAPYPFTTLHPVIGTHVFSDFTSIRVADVPGLIRDAHRGVGLGHAFLRHIERAGRLLLVVDMAGVDGRRPWEDYVFLQDELRCYREDLLTRPTQVIANKMDLPAARANLTRFRQETGCDPLPVSAQSGLGLAGLKQVLADWFGKPGPQE